MTQLEINIPFFRVWDCIRKEFVANGMFTIDNRFLTLNENNQMEIAKSVEIDMFTGRLANDQKPVYQNDLVEVESQNEFGSWRKYQAGIVYDISRMSYVLDEVLKQGEDPREETVATTKILAVIGHIHV